MVTIVNFKQQTNSEGEDFFVLQLQGGVELVKSKKTNRYYATARTTSLATTFDENTCRSLVGEKLPGKILKTACEPYEYTIQETGEVITLDYSYQFIPEEVPVEEVVPEEVIQ